MGLPVDVGIQDHLVLNCIVRNPIRQYLADRSIDGNLTRTMRVSAVDPVALHALRAHHEHRTRAMAWSIDIALEHVTCTRCTHVVPIRGKKLAQEPQGIACHMRRYWVENVDSEANQDRVSARTVRPPQDFNNVQRHTCAGPAGQRRTNDNQRSLWRSTGSSGSLLRQLSRDCSQARRSVGIGERGGQLRPEIVLELSQTHGAPNCPKPPGTCRDWNVHAVPRGSPSDHVPIQLPLIHVAVRGEVRYYLIGDLPIGIKVVPFCEMHKVVRWQQRNLIIVFLRRQIDADERPSSWQRLTPTGGAELSLDGVAHIANRLRTRTAATDHDHWIPHLSLSLTK